MVGPAGAAKTTTAVGSGLKKDPVVAVLYQHTGRCAVSRGSCQAGMPATPCPLLHALLAALSLQAMAMWMIE